MHAFITSWGEFHPTLEHVLVMFSLPVFLDEGATGWVLTAKKEKKV